jgi:hypothetical protein
MKNYAMLGMLAAMLFINGCTEAPRSANAAPATPGSFQMGGGLSPFYGEELHEGRLYVFGTKKKWEEFQVTKDMDPLNSRRLIGAGPNKMTLIVETTKDEPAKDKRILKTVAERYNLTLK